MAEGAGDNKTPDKAQAKSPEAAAVTPPAALHTPDARDTLKQVEAAKPTSAAGLPDTTINQGEKAVVPGAPAGTTGTPKEPMLADVAMRHNLIEPNIKLPVSANDNGSVAVDSRAASWLEQLQPRSAPIDFKQAQPDVTMLPPADLDRNTNITLIGDPNSRAYNNLADALARWQVPFIKMPIRNEVPDQIAGTPLQKAYEEGNGAVITLGDGSVVKNPTPDALAEKIGLHVHPDKPSYDLVVVGAGPAGLSAGVNGAAERLSTVIIGGDNLGGQAGLSSKIENLIGWPQGISGAQLTRNTLEQATRLGAETLVHNWATGLTENPDGTKSITLSDGNTITAKSVIVATGLTPRTLKAKDGTAIPGVEEFTGRGVFYGAGQEQTDQVDGQHITIVGGANSAGQAAVNLAENGAKCVDIIIRGPRIQDTMSGYLVDRINEINEAARAKTGDDQIKIHGNTVIDEKAGVAAKNDRMAAINVITDGKPQQLEADKMLVFIGSEPKADLGNLALDNRGFILTAKDLGDKWKDGSREPLPFETSMPGVFAVGDGAHGKTERVARASGQGSAAVATVFDYFRTVDQEKQKTGEAQPAAEGPIKVPTAKEVEAPKGREPLSPEVFSEKAKVRDLLDDAAKALAEHQTQINGSRDWAPWYTNYVNDRLKASGHELEDPKEFTAMLRESQDSFAKAKDTLGLKDTQWSEYSAKYLVEQSVNTKRSEATAEATRGGNLIDFSAPRDRDAARMAGLDPAIRVGDGPMLLRAASHDVVIDEEQRLARMTDMIVRGNVPDNGELGPNSDKMELDRFRANASLPQEGRTFVANFVRSSVLKTGGMLGAGAALGAALTYWNMRNAPRVPEAELSPTYKSAEH